MGSRSRAAVWLTAAGVGLFQVVGSFGAADNQPERKAVDALALVLVLAGPAALAVRDRWPLAAVAVSIAATNVYLALGYPYGPVFLSVAVALYQAVQAGKRRETWALAGAGFVGFVIAYNLDDRASPDLLHLALVAGWLVVVLAVSEIVRTRKEQTAERARAAEDERRRRVDEERLRLAQDLHDVLAHNISLINVQASVALHLLDDDPAQARPALATIKDVSKDTLSELRSALDVLRRGGADATSEEAPRSPTPRLADLDALVAGVRASGLDVRVERGADTPLPAPIEAAAYRIVQEALTNVTRHAGARGATVRIDYDDGVTIEVVDDGRGGSAEPGNGIRGMTERAAALGGTLEAGPSPTGAGFRVTAHLPVPPP